MISTLDTLKRKFQYLKDEYDFTLSKEITEDWGNEIDYINNHLGIGVRVTFELRESYIFVSLCRLVNGKIDETPRNIDENTTLNNFSLDDIVRLKNPSAILKALYEYPEDSKYNESEKGFSLYVEAFANNLRKYGSEALKGNFNELIPKLDKIVRDRAKKYGQYGKNIVRE